MEAALALAWVALSTAALATAGAVRLARGIAGAELLRRSVPALAALPVVLAVAVFVAVAALWPREPSPPSAELLSVSDGVARNQVAIEKILDLLRRPSPDAPEAKSEPRPPPIDLTPVVDELAALRQALPEATAPDGAGASSDDDGLFPLVFFLLGIGALGIAIFLVLRGSKDPWIYWPKRIGVVASALSIAFAVSFECAGKYLDLRERWQVAPESDHPIVILTGGSTVSGGDPVLATFLVPFRMASCARDWEKGTEPSEAQKASLSALARDLSACASKERPVKMEVRGYASSRPVADWRACPEAGAEGADDANRVIADARAASVEQILSGCGDHCTVTAYRWPSTEAMIENRRFNDRSLQDGSLLPDESRAVLTRRAEVRLQTAGECELVDPARVITGPDPGSSG